MTFDEHILPLLPDAPWVLQIEGEFKSYGSDNFYMKWIMY